MSKRKSGTTVKRWKIALADYEAFNDLRCLADKHPGAELIWGEASPLQWKPKVRGSLRHLKDGTWGYLYHSDNDTGEEPLAWRMRRFFNEEAEPVRVRCMVCGHHIFNRSMFAKETGLGLCKNPACRDAMAEAGIV